MTKKINFICYGVIFPIILSFIAYFGFTSKYALVHASLDKLPDLYYGGLYSYRFLSREILMVLYDYLNPCFEYLRGYSVFKPMNTIGTNFYLITILYNTIFYVLSCIVLYKLLEGFNTKNKKYLDLLYFFIILIVALSQYVITPFDNTSIFLFLISIWLSLKLSKNFSYKYNIILTFIIIISTCNRESSALSLSFYAAIVLNNSINKIFEKNILKKLFKHLCLPVLGFILTYVAIRMIIEVDKVRVIEGNYFMINLKEIKNIFGLLFYIILTYFSLSSSQTSKQKQNVKNYIIFSLPYILIIIYGGLLWEVRLYIPLLIGQFILANYPNLLTTKHE